MPELLASPKRPVTRPKSGGRRTLIILVGVVLTIALLGSLFVFVGLPALGCPKASASASTGAASDFCFAPFSGGSHAIGGLAAGPDGNLWFTEAAHIGRMTPAGTRTEFARGDTDSLPGAIVAGPDGNLWFIERTAKALGRITLAGIVTSFPLPAGATAPVGLTAGPDSALWYTRSSDARGAGGPPDTGTPGLIGRMTVSGVATEFALPPPPAPRPPAQPRDIISGPDGALWFDTGMISGGGLGDSWIGRITLSGQASLVYGPDPKALVSITALTPGPDHTLWFTQTSNNINSAGPGASGPPQITGSVGRLTPSGDVALFSLSSATPGTISAGLDGNLWFAAASGKIGRVTPTGQITLFALPDAQAEVSLMSEGPGRAIWCSQTFPDTDLINGLIWGTKIARITT
jgi:virginiamycin B lyase